MCSFRNYRRTISTGREGAVLHIAFSGKGFGLFGETKDEGIVSVEIDGGKAENYHFCKTGSREISCYFNSLENKAHTAKITVVKGTYSVDGMEVIL